MLEESLGYLTGVIKNVLHVLLSFFFTFWSFPICRNSLCYKSAFLHCKTWSGIIRGNSRQSESSNEWRKINFFTSDGRGVRDANCIPMPCALSQAVGHKRSIEKNKLYNETFGHRHPNLTLPCSGRVTEKITKQYTHTFIIIIIIP